MHQTVANLPFSRSASLFCATALLATVSGAATSAPTGATIPDGLEVGVIAYHYLYKEPGLMQLEGLKAGVRGSFSRTDDSGKHGRIEAMGSYGQVDYDSVRTGSSPNHDDLTLEMRVLFGLDVDATDGFHWQPYAGLGFRYLYNNLRGVNVTPTVIGIGYRRESNYLYLPVGVTTRHGSLVGNLEADFLLRGRQKSYLADTHLGDPDVTNSQHQGVGARASLMYDTGRFSIGPWINYWRIAKSDVVLGGYEPRNRTTEAGIELRFRN